MIMQVLKAIPLRDATINCLLDFDYFFKGKFIITLQKLTIIFSQSDIESTAAWNAQHINTRMSLQIKS